MNWAVIIELAIQFLPVIIELFDKDSAEWRLYAQRCEDIAAGKPGAKQALLATALECGSTHAKAARDRAVIKSGVPH